MCVCVSGSVCVCVCVAASGLSCGMQDLVAQPGRDPGPPALGAHSLSHPAAREVLDFVLWKKGGNRPIDTSVPSLLSRPVIFCRDASLSPLLSKPLENLCISSPPLSAALRAHARQYPRDPALCG